MNNQLIDRSCAAFTQVLASKAPVPGGGGAAALVGAIGTALCSMVSNLTVGRKKYAAFEEDNRIILVEAEKIRLRLLELVDEDAAAFEPLSNAYAIPKDDPKRAGIMENVTREACRTPMEMMRYICRAIELLEKLLEKGSVLLVSDVGCGALCCGAALKSAGMNIFVNTRALKNRDEAAELDAKADEMLRTYGDRAEQIAREVVRRLRGEESSWQTF